MLPLYAQTIIQGSTQDNVSVSTNIQGSGSVHTHIESTVNGQTKTIDTDKPGTYTLQNTGNGVSPIQGQQNTTHLTTTPTITATPTVKPGKISQSHHANTSSSILLSIQKHMHNFFQRILSLLHL